MNQQSSSSSAIKACSPLNKYQIIKLLGKGNYGVVKLGINILSGEKVAIKKIKYKNIKTVKEREFLEREKKILFKLDHPNVIKLHETFETSDKVFMVFEYAEGGELFQRIVSQGRLSEQEARKIFRQIVAAVDYCHYNLVIHRDLKPENILLDGLGNVKVSDFGLSNVIEPGNKFNTFCGSLHYVPPEVLKGEPYDGPGVDIWAMGIILYCLVVGTQPFDASSPAEMLSKIQNGIQFPKFMSNGLRDLIQKMLTFEEKKRVTLAEIKLHSWINEGFDSPPSAFSVPPPNLKVIKSTVMKQLVLMGYTDSPHTRREILQNEPTQLVATYRALLRRYEEKNGKTDSNSGKKRYSLFEAQKANIDQNEKKMQLRRVLKMLENNVTIEVSEERNNKQSKESSSNNSNSHVSASQFSWSTTSTKPIRLIKREVIRVLNETNAEWSLVADAHFQCFTSELTFDIQIADLRGSRGLRAIKMRKMEGNLWVYIPFAQKFVSKLKL